LVLGLVSRFNQWVGKQVPHRCVTSISASAMHPLIVAKSSATKLSATTAHHPRIWRVPHYEASNISEDRIECKLAQPRCQVKHAYCYKRKRVWYMFVPPLG
jgi:hypothetical protein